VPKSQINWQSSDNSFLPLKITAPPIKRATSKQKGLRIAKMALYCFHAGINRILKKKGKKMNTRRKAAQRKATIKSAALHIAAMAAFFVWALSAQLMIQGSI
jgi:hypothetical protein